MNVLSKPRIFDLAQRIDDVALNALVAELACYPKPGLVSLQDSGSHADMNASTFIASIASLRGYFGEMAQAGADGADFTALNALGREAERNMLEATNGVNTHRGAVFSLGLLAAAAGHCLQSKGSVRAADACRIVSTRWGRDMLATSHQCRGTHGADVRQRYEVQGAREHAADGFPVILHYALPALRKAFAAGLDPNWAGVHCFLKSIEKLDDTNLLHRGGLEALNFARTRAREILAAGGALSLEGRLQACSLHGEFVGAWLSPGGSADMLAMCYFLHGCEEAFGA